MKQSCNADEPCNMNASWEIKFWKYSFIVCKKHFLEFAHAMKLYHVEFESRPLRIANQLGQHSTL